MPITIILPDGSQYMPEVDWEAKFREYAKSINYKGAKMSTNDTGQTNAAQSVAQQGLANQVLRQRSIAVVAAELQHAMLAAAAVKQLSDELHALLGKKKRGPRAKKAV